jgi:hypothetical protein
MKGVVPVEISSNHVLVLDHVYNWLYYVEVHLLDDDAFVEWHHYLMLMLMMV